MKKKFLPLKIILLISIFNLISCKDNSEQKLNIEELPYIKELPIRLSNLNAKQKTKRDSIIKRLNSNSIFKELVEKKAVDEKYIKLLEGIAVIVSRKKTYGGSDIPLDLEKQALTDTTSELFFKQCFVLENNGGFTKDIVEVYLRYLDKYGLYNKVDNIKYNTSGDQLVGKEFNLSPIALILDPDNKEYLKAYIETMNSGQNSWRLTNDSEKVNEFAYPQLVSKSFFFVYVERIDPNSSLLNYGYDIQVGFLNVKKVDDKYRYFFNIMNKGNQDFTGDFDIELKHQNGDVIPGKRLKNQTIRAQGGTSFYIELSTGLPFVHGEYGIVGYQYTVELNGTSLKEGNGSIPNSIIEEL